MVMDVSASLNVPEAVFKKFEKENLFQIMCAGELVDPLCSPGRPDDACRHCGALPAGSHAVCDCPEEHDRDGRIGSRFSAQELYPGSQSGRLDFLGEFHVPWYC